MFKYFRRFLRNSVVLTAIMISAFYGYRMLYKIKHFFLNVHTIDRPYKPSLDLYHER